MKVFVLIFAYIRARLRKRWTRKHITRHQKRRVKKVVRYAKRNSPFYRDLFKGKSEFFDLPIISKKIMMENFSSLNTKKIDKKLAFMLAEKKERSRTFDSVHKGIAIGLSSGTSGNKGIFLTSEKERAFWAGSILAKTIPSVFREKTSIGLFLRSSNLLYETLRSKRVSFHYFDLQHPFENLFKKLEKTRPKILVAPPSILRMLVESKLDYVPDKVIACAEMLDPLDKKIIENYFKQTLHQVYQCTEGLLAVSCSYGTLHINEDLVLLEKEYIDKEGGRFVPILTDLYRTTQPLIRYRLDDILVEKKDTCLCNSHFLALEKIEGRCDDILYFKNTEGQVVPVFPDFIRREILFSDDKIQDFQVIQKSFTEMSVYTNPPTSTSSVLHSFLAHLGVLVPKIHQMKSPMKREQWEKKRRIIREFHV